MCPNLIEHYLLIVVVFVFDFFNPNCDEVALKQPNFTELGNKISSSQKLFCNSQKKSVPLQPEN